MRRGPHLHLLWILTLLTLVFAGACEDDSSGVVPVGATAAGSGSTSPGSSGGGQPVPPVGSGGPKLVFDLASNHFYDTPWPSDARKTNGHPDVSALPDPGQTKLIGNSKSIVHQDVEGFSPSGVIAFRFDGPINAPSSQPTDHVQPSSPIRLVNIDPASPDFGRLHPCLVKVNRSADSFRPAHLLQILPVPGLRLEEDTLYAAIVLRRLGAPGATHLDQAPAMTALLKGRTPGSGGAAWTSTFRPLVNALPTLGIQPAEVAAATVFRTGHPTEALFRYVRHEQSQPARSPNGPLALHADYPTYRALKGEWSPPQYQTGIPPFVLGGGTFVEDANGHPSFIRGGKAPFTIAVPKGKMPPNGFPLFFYIHGTGGKSTQVLDRGVTTQKGKDPPKGTGPALWAAEKGWGACSTGLPLNPERIGFLSVDGYIPYNFYNPGAMRDNFLQMVLELVMFRKLVLNLRIDPALCPGTDASAAPDGKIRFDPSHIVVHGQSLGSYLAGMMTATAGGFEGAVLSGAGGSWIEFAFGPVDPVDLRALVESLIIPGSPEPIDRFHPVITLFEMAVGPGDNTQYVPYIYRDPRHVPPHMLVVQGVDDNQVPTFLQRALSLASGTDLAGGDPGPVLDKRIAPVFGWGGRKQIPLPAKGNLQIPGYGTRTGVSVRYLPDAVTNEGHFAVYQRPEARNQVKSLLETLIRDGVPTIPK